MSAPQHVIYFAPRDIVIPRVDRISIVNFCQALSQHGARVTLACFKVQLHFPEPVDPDKPLEAYGVESGFRVVELPSLVSQRSGRHNPLWRAFVYHVFAFRELVLRRQAFHRAQVVLYAKNYLVGAVLLPFQLFSRRRVLLFFEVHIDPMRARQSRLSNIVLRHAHTVVAISQALADDLQQRGAVRRSQLLVAHQGVAEERLNMRSSRETARSRLGLDSGKRYVVYTGKVTSKSSEVESLVAASAYLPSDVMLLLVGGRADHVERWRQRTAHLRNVRFQGFVRPAEIHWYQLASDVLVSYYGEDSELNDYRSPGKLFEYMASGRPIVIGDYKSSREILGDDGALFVPPGDRRALGKVLSEVLNDKQLADNLGETALERVKEFTWSNRARIILDRAAEAFSPPRAS